MFRNFYPFISQCKLIGKRRQSFVTGSRKGKARVDPAKVNFKEQFEGREEEGGIMN